MSDSRVLIERFESEALKGNYLADPSTRRVAVYLPPGYDEGNARYPVVFLLVGFTGRGTMLMNESAWGENIRDRLDRLVRSERIVPMIVVMPDCFTRYGGSQYINSVGTGRYQDHIVEELVPWVDGKFRTVQERDFRAAVGKSSGGYGSLMLGLQHPDKFGLVACHSGDMYFELCYGPDLIKHLRAAKKFGGLDKFLQEFRDIRPKDGDFHAVLETAAMASCYSPNLAAPYGFDLPFDEYTGEWREEVWARWKASDPIELIGAQAEALRSLRLLYLDSGARDEFNLQFGARTFCARLERRGIPYHYEEFDDGHMDVQYRYDVSLEAISAVWRG
jgi:S-formylglutathione hydrolase FrmB